MFRDADEVRAALLSQDPTSFVSHHIFEPVPFAFESDRFAWVNYKQDFASLLDVDPQEIVLTGSAAIGFSLNPFKSLSKFSATSDFDFGVVSGYHFDLAWRYLRKQQISWLTLPKHEKDAIKSHRKSYVFKGTIAANWFLQVLPFGKVWQDALDKLSVKAPANGRTINLRIYKDYDCLRFYQSETIEKIRDSLLGDVDIESEVAIYDDEDEEETIK